MSPFHLADRRGAYRPALTGGAVPARNCEADPGFLAEGFQEEALIVARRHFSPPP